jgi:CDP-glucose 4,6-dehydratase
VEGLDVTPAFWRDKRVFLTGHSGFKGGWLSLWLQQLGAEVIGYSLEPPSDPSLFTLARVADGMVSLHGNICDLDALQAAVRKHRPDIVIHMAAQALVRRSYADPVETYAANVMGTVNLLEAVRRTGSARAVLIITSDKCYENRNWHWGYRENEAMGGYDPYSSSKGCAELVTAAYRRSYFGSGPATASARAGNVIGGGDWADDRLIPDTIRAILRGEAVRIRSPRAVRPWQHVLEPLHGYLMLLERLWTDGAAIAEGWNFGPDDRDARPVSDIVAAVVRLWGDSASWVSDDATHPHEAAVLRLDCSKARQLIGWRPILQLDSALEWVVDWYKDYSSRRDMRVATLDQISRFQRLVGDQTHTARVATA